MLETDAPITQKHEPTYNQQIVSGFPITVVVVERETISRVMLSAVLSCDGYRVFQTDNPITAISYFRTDDPAVLFIDLDMLEWASVAHHALDIKPNILLIGMVGNNPITDTSDLKRCGINVCLQKPVLYNDLRRTLSEYVYGRPAA